MVKQLALLVVVAGLLLTVASASAQSCNSCQTSSSGPSCISSDAGSASCSNSIYPCPSSQCTAIGASCFAGHCYNCTLGGPDCPNGGGGGGGGGNGCPKDECSCGDGTCDVLCCDQVTHNIPSVDMFAEFPWITDPDLPTTIAGYMTVKGMDRPLQRFQALELGHGIEGRRMESFISKETGETIVAIVFLKAKDDKKLYQAVKVWAVPTVGTVYNIRSLEAGTVGKLQEELELTVDHWTLTNAKGTFTGKVAAYVPPEEERATRRAQCAARNRTALNLEKK